MGRFLRHGTCTLLTSVLLLFHFCYCCIDLFSWLAASVFNKLTRYVLVNTDNAREFIKQKFVFTIEIRSVERGIRSIAESIMTDTVLVFMSQLLVYYSKQDCCSRL